MAALDHIVLLLSTPDFEKPPLWLSENFTIIVGGTHTGQSSRNKLIFFKDGTYLELFNWFDDPPNPDDEKQPMRVWGQKHPGLIDFALTTTGASPEEYIDALNQRLEGNKLGISYQQPVPGGRKRKDGIDVKWKVSRPKFQTASHTPSHSFFPGGRLDAPFFCDDVTERNMRVLFEDKKATSHPCDAIGISEVQVAVPLGEVNDYLLIYKAVCNAEESMTTSNDEGRISVPCPVATATTTSQITIRVPEDMSRIRERGVGISDIVLTSGDRNLEKQRKQLGTHGIASTLWLE